MTELLKIIRPWTTSFLTALSILLTWGLPPVMSFADVSLLGTQDRVISPIDPTLPVERYSMRGDVSDHGKIPPGTRDACFSISDRLGSQVGGSEPASLILPMYACVGLRVAFDGAGWSGYEAQGDHARSVGNWSEAEQFYAKAVELLDRATLPFVDQNLASLLNKLGSVRFGQKNFAGAEASHRRALTIYQATRGADDLRVADTLDLLGTAWFEQHSGHELAGSLFFRAWAIRETALGPNHPDVADSLHRLALSLYSDNISFAIPLLLRSVEIREKVFGHDHPAVADSLHAMARLYEGHHRRDLAIPLYQQALAIQEKVFGPNALETMQVRNSLDTVHQGTDHSIEAPGTAE